MAARRCSTCTLNYPSHGGWEKCVQCGGTTYYNSAEDAMTPDEARALKARVEFDKFYAERELERMLDPAYVPPEQDPALRAMSWQDIVVASTPVPDVPPA